MDQYDIIIIVDGNRMRLLLAVVTRFIQYSKNTKYENCFIQRHSR